MQVIDVPVKKTHIQQLEELEVGKGFVIDNAKRQSWANTISNHHRVAKKRFAINYNKDTNITTIGRTE